MKNQSSALKAIVRGVTLVSAVLIVVAAAQAATLVVGNGTGPCTNPQYSSIQMAVNASNHGDTIDVCPGTYHEQVFIDSNHSKITVQGITVQNQNQVIIQPFSELPVDSIVYVLSAKDVTLKNLTIDGGSFPAACFQSTTGVDYAASTGKMIGLAVQNIRQSHDNPSCSPAYGITVHGNGPGHVEISDTTVHDVENYSIYVQGADQPTGTALDVNVKGNSIAGGNLTGLVVMRGITFLGQASGVIDGNVVTFGSCVAPNGCGSMSPLESNIFVGGLSNGVKVTNNILARNRIGIFIQASDCDLNNNIISNSYRQGVQIEGNNNNAKGNSIFQSLILGINVGGNNNTVQNNIINEAQIGLQSSGNNNLGSAFQPEKGKGPTGNTFFNTQTRIVIFTPSGS